MPSVIAATGTMWGGFVVDGRHLSFGNDPATQLSVGGQLFSLHRYNAVPPGSVRVWVDYGRDRVSEADFSQRLETVDWSQARYDDYGFVALDVTPAAAGQRTTMVLRFINEQGRELDRVVFSRNAGAGLIG
jgi:hypothetical protein